VRQHAAAQAADRTRSDLEEPDPFIVHAHFGMDRAGNEACEPAGARHHVANPLLQLSKHRLAVELLPLFVEVDPLEMTGARDLALAHAAGEEMTLPLWKAVAGVEAQS